MNNVHYVFAIDCSYSMYSDLPNLRKDLKNKIATVAKPNDCISIIYFSGNKQYGSLVNFHNLTDVQDLDAINNSIDNWLKPIGATAFAGPLKKAKEFSLTNYTNVLMFITDGYNNDSPVSEVIEEASTLSKFFDFTFFVEYGMYCDSKFIQKLTELSAGVGLNATSFTALSEIFNRTLVDTFVPKQKVIVQTNGAKRIYSMTDQGDLYVFESLEALPAISIETPANTLLICSDIDCADTDSKIVCAMAALKRGDADLVEKLLLEVNSNEIYQKWYNCYGKDKLIGFYEYLKEIFINEGWKNLTPIEPPAVSLSVYQIMQNLAALDAKVKVQDYQRIGAEKDTDILTPEQTTHMATLKSKKEIDAYVESLKPLQFTSTSGDFSGLSNLVFNTERANVSMLIKREGYVDLPENKWGLKTYRTHTYRNYTVIKDGILNMPSLLIEMDKDVVDFLKENDLLQFCSETVFTNVASLDLSQLPVILRSDIQSLTAKEMAENALKLEEIKAALKAIKYFNKEANPKMQETDPELNEWLKGYGITYNGFNPSAGKGESTDFYMAPSLVIKIKGLSSLPAVEAVMKKIEDGKNLTLADTLVKKGIDSAKAVVNVSTDALNSLNNGVLAEKRRLELNLAKSAFSLILSKGWFKDLNGFDDNTVQLGENTITFELKEVEIKI